MRTVTAIIILSIMMLSSCISSRPERLESKRQRKCELAAYRWGCSTGYDSTMVIRETKTIYRDTTIYVYVKGDVRHDTVRVFVTADGLINSKVSHLKTDFAWSWAQVVNGQLRHELRQNDTAVAAHLVSRSTFSTELQKKTTVVTVYQNKLKKWQQNVIYGFFILLALNALYVAYRIAIRRK